MNRRTILIIILAISFIALAVVGYILIASQDSTPVDPDDGAAISETPSPDGEGTDGAPPPDTTEIEVTLAPTNRVVVSWQTVQRGYQFTEDVLKYDERQEDDINSNMFTNIEDVVGLYARTDIFQGETLTKDDLVSDPTLIGDNYGPSSLIPPGFVAMAVPMDRLSSVAYALDEGDYIDIMLSFVFYKVDPQFQTLLSNSATFPIEVVQEAAEGEEAKTITSFLVVDPLGRFEELPNGDLAHITPNGDGRPVPVSMILQNAKVVQVGEWQPTPPVQAATPTPEPVEDPNAQPTPDTGVPVIQATPTLSAPTVLLIALSPQQQLFLKYAIESGANIDFAMRGVNDGQLYSVENISLEYLLQRFSIEPPPPIEYTLGVNVTATPPAEDGGGAAEPVPEGGG